MNLKSMRQYAEPQGMKALARQMFSRFTCGCSPQFLPPASGGGGGGGGGGVCVYVCVCVCVCACVCVCVCVCAQLVLS